MLDRRTPVTVQTFDLLAALTAVRLAMKTVHCDRQGLMRFLGNGSVRHGSRLESGHNRIHALYFFDRDSLLRIIEFQLSPEVDLLSFHVHHLRILPEHPVISPPGRLLEHMDGLRIIKMPLSAAL